MSRTSRTLRLMVGASILGSVVLMGHADAASSAKLYFRQEGCGATEEPGRLEPTSGTDSADGCGYIGGVPLDEAIGAEPIDFASSKAVKPIRLDNTKKVTGVYAVGAWALVGAGEVTVDMTMVGKTTKGASVNFGEFSSTVMATPSATGRVDIPFTFTMPASAKNATLSKVTISVAVHGLNLGYNAKSFSGTSYVTIPSK